MPRSVRPAAGWWQAAMPERNSRRLFSLSCGDCGRSPRLVCIEKTFADLQKINAGRSGVWQTNAAAYRHAATIQ
jgi:hypothetical protein